MFVIQIDWFDVKKTYETCQAPRARKLNDNTYLFINGDKMTQVEQVSLKNGNRYFKFSCTEKDFYDVWFNYFDLSFDYSKEFYKQKLNVPFFKKPCVVSKGVHKLNQGELESYIYSSLLKMMGFKNARRTMNAIAESCGKKKASSLGDWGRVIWYTFPNAEDIVAKMDKSTLSKDLKDYIKGLCSIVDSEALNLTSNGRNYLYKLFISNNGNRIPSHEIKDILKAKNKTFSMKKLDKLINSNGCNSDIVYLNLLYYFIKQGDIRNGVN